MIRPTTAAILVLMALSACAPRVGAPTLVLLDPYREPNDSCRLVAPTSYAKKFPRFRGDIVACPASMPNLALFAADVNAVAVDRVPGYVIYAVPRP
jgi:hypothetical protein